MKKRVFISRKPEDCESIRAFLPSDLELIPKSLIETKSIRFDSNIPETDWIFFSSSNAVHHFFGQHPTIHRQKIGAIGEATANAVRHYRNADFIGDSMDIADSAYRFAEIIGNQTVLFPGATESLRHIQSALPPHQVVDFPVYTTFEKNIQVPECDVYVFSSPSNVRSFFSGNPSVQKGFMKCIAFGEATEKELKRFAVADIEVPESLEPHSIAHAIIRALKG